MLQNVLLLFGREKPKALTRQADVLRSTRGGIEQHDVVKSLVHQVGINRGKLAYQVEGKSAEQCPATRFQNANELVERNSLFLHERLSGIADSGRKRILDSMKLPGRVMLNRGTPDVRIVFPVP